jgi:hypothetical protein
MERVMGMTAMDGGNTGNARLHGGGRYDYKEVIGRIEPGAKTENDSGDKVEEQLPVRTIR